MITITTFSKDGEEHFRPGEHNLEDVSQLHIGQVTNEDFVKMMDTNSDFWKIKVRELLERRPFNK